MGLFDRFRRAEPQKEVIKQRVRPAVGAVESAGQNGMAAFDNKNITYTGDLTSYDYDSILRDKQGNINQLYQLADYFTDADPLFRGIVKGVYVPFTMASPYKLIGANESVKQRYKDYYDRINLEDRMRSIFLQYYKYGNVYLYLMDNGNLISLPVHKCRIGNIAANGEPVIEFDVASIKNDLASNGTPAQKDYFKDDDLKVKATAFPPEVAKALSGNAQWIQLNPENTFVLQDLKEDWQRYAVPMIASCLGAFSKKAIIQNYEKSMLNLASRGFLHVKYGDPVEENPRPDLEELTQLDTLFKRALSAASGASPLAVTNNWVESEFVTIDMKEFFEDDKYKSVNAEILSAGGISGILVSGISDTGSTFATAQVSMQTAAMRIKHARDNFCEMMNKINARLNGVLPHAKTENIPSFEFMPVDLAGDSKFQEVCFKLWQQGVLSSKTMLDMHGFDMEQEVERKKQEDASGVTEILMKAMPQVPGQATPGSGGTSPGRPKKNDGTVDEGKSQSGAQPKPSNPEGSEPSK